MTASTSVVLLSGPCERPVSGFNIMSSGSGPRSDSGPDGGCARGIDETWPASGSDAKYLASGSRRMWPPPRRPVIAEMSRRLSVAHRSEMSPQLANNRGIRAVISVNSKGPWACNFATMGGRKSVCCSLTHHPPTRTGALRLANAKNWRGSYEYSA